MNIDDRWICSRCLHLIERGHSCGNCGFTEEDYQPKPYHLPPETLLKQRYLVASVLGEGGFGITYAGWDLILDKPIAIKEYFPVGLTGRDASVSFCAHPGDGQARNWYFSGRERFLREARILAMLSGVHGIVPVRDFFEENETAYIIMDFIHGESLRDYARHNGGCLNPSVLFPLLRPVLDALILVHQSGILHRDISPDNILIDRNGSAWLIDFGAAEELRPDNDPCSRAVILRKGYTPLEQYNSHGQQGPWSDVYALSATIYDLLCGHPPVEASQRLGKDILISPAKFRVHLSRRQQRALLHGLSLQVSDRPLSMEHFRSELYGLPLPADLLRRRIRLRRITWGLSAGIIFSLLLAVNTWVGFPSPSGCRFSFSGDGVSLRAYAGSDIATVPAHFLGLTVQSVADNAFRNLSSLTSVTLPNSIQAIGNMAFEGCTSLSSIDLPNGLTHIGAYAFADCTSLKCVPLPQTVIEVSDSAFIGHSNSLILSAAEDSYVASYAAAHDILSFDPAAYTYVITNGYATITEYLGSAANVVIPGTIGGYPVASIGENAFSAAKVTSVSLADGISHIDDSAFLYCYSLQKVALPSSITSIGDSAFYCCYSLADIQLPGGLTEIGESAFSYTTSLESAALPSSLQRLGYEAFSSSGLLSVSIPSGITNLPEGLFYFCEHLADVTLPDGLISVGDRAFEGCLSLQHVRLPESTVAVGYRSFAGCTALQTVWFPREIQSIDPEAFGGEQDYPAYYPVNVALLGYPNTAVQRVATESNLLFDDVTLWEDLSNLTYEEQDGTILITGYHGNAVDLILPTYINNLPVTEIGEYAFGEIDTIQSIVLPRRLETIFNSAFCLCTSLKQITFPASLRRIDYFAFYHCNLNELSIPDSVITIGYNAFEENRALRRVSIGSGLTFLNEMIFYGCESLESIKIESVSAIGGFSDLPLLRSVVLGGGVRFIQADAFTGCSSLQNVYFVNSALTIADGAFGGDSFLTIHAGADSAASTYAKENGFRYISYP
jgi:serine/threonine protein kinase